MAKKAMAHDFKGDKMNEIPVNGAPMLKPEAPETDKKNSELMEACQEFESILVGQILSTMHEASLKSGLMEENSLFGGGSQNQMFTQMLDDEIGKSVSHEQGLGLANLLYEQLTGTSGTGSPNGEQSKE
jgi:flagellar protein FlgJ